jgi:hypothetical protein
MKEILAESREEQSGISEDNERIARQWYGIANHNR